MSLFDPTQQRDAFWLFWEFILPLLVLIKAAHRQWKEIKLHHPWIA